MMSPLNLQFDLFIHFLLKAVLHNAIFLATCNAILL